MMARWALLVVVCVCAGWPVTAGAGRLKVVPIGGPASEAQGRHPYPGAIRFIQSLLEAAAGQTPGVRARPDTNADKATFRLGASSRRSHDGVEPALTGCGMRPHATGLDRAQIAAMARAVRAAR